MIKVIGVRFKFSGRIYYFDPVDYDVQVGDEVIVETARGQEFGDVVQGITEVEDTVIVAPLKPVLRLASDHDKSMRVQNSGKEDDAFAACQKKIAEHKLDMKLVDVEYSFNGSKVVFYFTADERVDFRDLVKDLAAHFKTRIELRQIGVRDEAKMLGGLGSCGRPVCCKTFLDDFRPVSIKMAKEQNLSLSPTKISGLCGRLMCCLQYEQASYEEMKKKMPRVNREILTPDGPGYAIENNAITERTKVRVNLPDGTIDMREYHYSLLGVPGEPLPQSVIDARQALQQTAAEAQPAPGEPFPAQQPRSNQQPEGHQQNGQGNRHRRRGGGRGGESSGSQQSPQAQQGQQSRQRQQSQRNGQGGEGSKQGQQERGQRQGGGKQSPGGRPGNKPANNPSQQKAQPERQDGTARPENGQQKPNPNRRRRRRGGSDNGPRPEQPPKSE